MKPTKKARRKDKLDHICDLVDLEWNGMITRDELVRRLTAICEKKHNKVYISPMIVSPDRMQELFLQALGDVLKESKWHLLHYKTEWLE